LAQIFTTVHLIYEVGSPLPISEQTTQTERNYETLNETNPVVKDAKVEAQESAETEQ
jgi:hypothetical protein